MCVSFSLIGNEMSVVMCREMSRVLRQLLVTAF